MPSPQKDAARQAATPSRTGPHPLLPWLVTCALFMENLDATVLNTVTPAIAGTFRVPVLQLKLALTAYLVGVAIFIPISGWVAERFGSGKVFTAAITVFTLGSFACGVSNGLVSLVLARLVQGVGGALMVPVARLVLMRAYPKEELVRITNLTTVPSLVGPAIGPLLGGLLATYVHWRAVFFVNVPFGLLGLWVAHKALDNAHHGDSKPFDKVGFVYFSFALAGLSFGLEALGEPFLTVPQQMMLVVASFAALALFTLHAHGHPKAFFDLDLFHIRTFRLGVLGSFMSRVGIGGVPFLLPLMYQLRFGLTAFESGLLVSPLAVAMLLAKGLVGPLLRALGFRRLLIVNTLLLGATLSSFATIAPHTPVWLRLALAFVYGGFASVHFTCMNVLAYVDVEESRMTDASNMVSTAQVFAMSAGVGLAALIVHIFLHLAGTLGGSAAYAFHRAFAFLGAITALSTVMFYRLSSQDGRVASGHSPGGHG